MLCDTIPAALAVAAHLVDVRRLDKLLGPVQGDAVVVGAAQRRRVAERRQLEEGDGLGVARVVHALRRQRLAHRAQQLAALLPAPPRALGLQVSRTRPVASLHRESLEIKRRTAALVVFDIGRPATVNLGDTRFARAAMSTFQRIPFTIKIADQVAHPAKERNNLD